MRGGGLPERVLDPLATFPFGGVPSAGASELETYRQRVRTHRENILVFGSVGILGAGCAWLLSAWATLIPTAFIVLFAAIGAAGGLLSARSFLALATGQRLYQALPEGTTESTALLEDALHKRIREWNEEAKAWNAERARWFDEVWAWRRAHENAEARDIEWSEEASEMRRLSLEAALDGLHAERRALAHRRRGIERLLHELGTSLPPPAPDDPADDG